MLIKWVWLAMWPNRYESFRSHLGLASLSPAKCAKNFMGKTLEDLVDSNFLSGHGQDLSSLRRLLQDMRSNAAAARALGSCFEQRKSESGHGHESHRDPNALVPKDARNLTNPWERPASWKAFSGGVTCHILQTSKSGCLPN